MATVTELELIVLQNTYRDNIFEKSFEIDAYAIAAEAPLFAVRKENFAKILFQTRNTVTSGTPTLNLSYYATGDSDFETTDDEPVTNLGKLIPPIWESGSNTWTLLTNGTSTVDSGSSAARNITDNWTWVLVTGYLDSDTIDLSIKVRGE